MSRVAPAQLHHWLSRITYKPGWTMRLVDPSPGEDAAVGTIGYEYRNLVLVVEVPTADSRNPGQQVVVTHRQPVPPFFEGWHDFVRWVRYELHATEIHEADEWIRVDGEMVFDPHEVQSHRGPSPDLFIVDELADFRERL